MKKSPNWLDMPHELMVNVLQRLRTSEILKSARKVCTTWRTICNDPAMWKVIHLNKWQDGCDTNCNVEMLTKQAVDLSRGELVDITIVSFGTDDLLEHIVLRSNKLKRLHIVCCEEITGSGISRAVKWAPQPEELRVFYASINADDIEAIGQNCPQLKSFRVDKKFKCDDVDALAIANNMHELRLLSLYSSRITNYGLEAILNGCPHLESLDVRMCYNLVLDRNSVKLCKEWIKDFKHKWHH